MEDSSIILHVHVYLLDYHETAFSPLLFQNGNMRAACATYISRRKGLLHQLRKENMLRFIQVVEALDIDYKPLDPFHFRPTIKQMRKKEVRDECYAKRLNKMEAFRKALDAEREEFYAQKEETLKVSAFVFLHKNSLPSKPDRALRKQQP